jgi:RNA polymerase sigma-70 factor (ECF subfamily)
VDGEDRRLVERCLAGDQAACADLVRLHTRVVGTVIWRATGEAASVEDLAQDTFLRVFRALPLFAGESKLSTWICTIAHRVAIDHGRRTSRRKESALPPDEDEQEAMLAQHGTAAPDPELLASRDEAERLVREHVAKLPDKYRLPLVYAAMDELDYATIGAMLNMPIGTVKTMVFRAKQMLKANIAASLERTQEAR